jgi:hypothetical protein
VRILLRRENGPWTTVDADPFDLEADLQSLLLSSPGLIPDDVSSGDRATAWCREYPSTSGPIDLVGVGNTGSITVVECKLASSSDIKRKVVGQVLDYRAALWNTPAADFEALFSRAADRFDPDGGGFVDQLSRRSQVGEFALDAAELRAAVAERLAVGHFRLVIAVDEIDPELHRIVDYVNDRGRGSALKLVALTFPRYRSGDIEVLTPETYGDEAAPPPSSTRRTWDEASLMASMEPDDAAVAASLLAWARTRGLKVRWGSGAKHGSFLVERSGELGDYQLFNVQGNGRVWVTFKSLARSPGFRDRGDRLRLLDALPVFDPAWGQDAVDRFPNVDIAQLADPDVIGRFTEAMDFALGVIDSGEQVERHD